MAETTPGNPTGSQRKELNQRFTEAYFGATIRVPTAFTTSEIRRSFNRLFDTTSRCVFFCRFYSQLAGGNGAVDRMASHIGGAIKTAGEDIDKRIALADTLIQQGGITFNFVSKSRNATAGEAIIVDPLAMQYLRLMEKAERLSQKLQALWLSTVLNDHQLRQANNELQTVLRGVYFTAQSLNREIQDRWRANSHAEDESARSESEMESEFVGLDHLEMPGVAASATRLTPSGDPAGQVAPAPSAQEKIEEKQAA